MSDADNKALYLPYAPGPDPAAGPRPLAAILADLERPVHASFLQTKTKKGTEITFISWHTATRILDKYAPGWQWETTSHLSQDGQHVVVDGLLGLPTSDYGIVWRGATGWDEDEDKAYGDASDRAESQALRRCAAKFRLCLYLYYEKGATGPTQKNPRPPAGAAAAPASPAPTASPPASVSVEADPNGFDAIAPAASTPQQHGLIRHWLPKAGMTETDLCGRLEIVQLADLPNVRAQHAIDWLEARAKKKKGQAAA